jgi:hypothetical protein
MAPSGHRLMHTPHPKQVSKSMVALDSSLFKEAALKGHTDSHVPQPEHFCRSTVAA